MDGGGGATFAGGGERPINTNLFISVIALKLGELYTCCPKTNRYCVLKGERLAISCALLHNLIFIDTGNQCKSGFFKVNLSGGVYEAYGEDFYFEPFCLPVHSAGRLAEG